MTDGENGIAAFEHGAELGWARGFAVAVGAILRRPTETFGGMEREGSIGLALVFVTLVTFLPELPTTAIELAAPGVLAWAGPGLEGDMAARIAGALDYWGKLGGLFLLELAMTTPLLWAMLKITRQRCPSLRAIFRVACYSSAPTLIAPGVVLSTVVSFWGLYLFCVGIKQVGGPRPIAVFGALFVGQLGGAFLLFAGIAAFNAIVGA
jgi:hypothetical protein